MVLLATKLVFILFTYLLSVSSACYTHADCSSGAHVAYCLRVKCIPISGFVTEPSASIDIQSSPQPDDEEPLQSEEPYSESLSEVTGDPVQRTENLTFSDIVKLTNEQVISRSVRRATIRQIRYLSSQINVNEQVYRSIHRQSISRILIRLLRRQRRNTSAFAFHSSLLRTLRKTHDLHFRYFPGYPLEATVATLGFTISRYFTPLGESAYILSDIVPGFERTFPDCFAIGSTVTAIDDVPVEQAVQKLAQDTYGANPDAKTQRATDGLTIRQAVEDALPRQSHAKISVATPNGRTCVARARWVFSLSWYGVSLSSLSSSRVSALGAGARVGLGPGKQTQTRMIRFPQNDRTALHTLSIARMVSTPERRYFDVARFLADFVSASVLKTAAGEIGVLKLSAFPEVPSQDVIDELKRVLRLLPENGLVVDIRDNQGGVPSLCTAVTKLISGVDVPKMPFSLRASNVTLQGARARTEDNDTQAMFRAFETANENAIRVKQMFTGPAADIATLLAPPDTNGLERSYFGPIITLTSAISYSGGDLFAVMQKDLNASYTIGVDRTTGGGGAGIISFQWLAYYFPETLKNTRFVDGADTVFPFLRFYRAGRSGGGLVEHFGVEPDEWYKRTKLDVMDRDRELFDYVAKKLKSMKA